MAVKTRDLTRDWRRGDAERLARFYNETGEGWPGGPWDPQTPEDAERHLREQPLLGAFVADEGDHFAAFCSLYAKPNEKNRAYVPLLSALLSYHGKGYGKAVLHRSVERVYELGIARVDLHTWPGNLKAVPLYKKTGFMWSPAEPWGVLMQNFTPGARRHPVAQTFFRQHDWYATMKRDLALVPDDHKRGKVRVYPYEWEEEGERLRMVYDRQSWGLVELETNEFLVGCFLEDEKLVAGLPQRIRWQIVNYTGKPLEVALIATAEEGIALDHKEFLQVRTKAELGAEFRISPEITEKEKEPRAPIIHTELLINGTPISLAAGLEVKQPVSFGLDMDGVGLRPGREEQLILQVWSDLDKPAEARVRVSGSAGVSLGLSETTVHLPAKGSQEVALPLQVAQPGVVELKAEAEVQYGGATLKPKTETLSVRALAPGDLAGHVEKKRVVLESAALRVIVWRQGGWTEVFDKLRNRNLASLRSPMVGPPMAWDEFFDTPCDARIEREGDRVTAVLGTDSIHSPGVRLERRLSLSNSSLLAVADSVINGGAGELKGRIHTGAHLRTADGAMYAATPQGLARGWQTTTGRQFGEHNLSEEGEDWPEGWIAQEDKTGCVVGLLWEGATRVRYGWGSGIERPLERLAPGQSATLPPVYLYVGEGTALTVRRWWQMLYRDRQAREQHVLDTRPPFVFGLEPRPVVVHGDQAEAKLGVNSIGRLELSGTVKVSPPEGLRLQPNDMEFEKVCATSPASVQVTISTKKGTPEGGYFADVTATLDRMVYHERQPILFLGDPKGSVTVKKAGKQTDLLRADNGLLALTVAPGFTGAAISLESQGQQFLRSAYPEARPLAWENPWHGGIEPDLGSLGRDLAKERFSGRVIERRGGQGILWRGVRVSCSPKEDRARHHRLEVDYLLAPGSRVFAVALRTIRRTDTAGWLDASFSLWPILGGSFLDAEITTSDDPRATLLRTDFGRGAGGRRWIIADNREQGQAVVLACDDVHASVYAQVFGRDGYYLSAHRGDTHEARETQESVFFVSFLESDRARDLAEVLAEVKGLP